MKAELIAVGTEILLGEITDTNTPFIARELANLGIDVYFQSTVGDNPERLEDTIKLAAKRSDLVILSGGLGPTEDDLTKQTVASFLHRELVIDHTAMAKIERYFSETQRTMTENNRLQAMYLKGAKPLSNRTGFAVGIFDQELQGPDFLLLPGPPSELEPMMMEQVLPLLKKTYLGDHVLRSRVLRFFGIGESQLTTELADLIATQNNPTIAPYAKQNEVTLRLTAWAQTDTDAQKKLNDCENRIQALVGKFFYGYGEHNSLAQVVATHLIKQQLTIAVVEGYTAGRFSTALDEFSDEKNVFDGGFILATNTEKKQSLIGEFNVSASKSSVEKMVSCLKKKTKSDLSMVISHASTEKVSSGEQVGSVWIAISDKNENISAKKYNFSTIRPATKQRIVLNALQQLNDILK